MRFSLAILFQILISTSFAQGFAELYGVVKDQDGAALIGAHISIADSAQFIAVIATDQDGKYKIKVPLNQNLEVHFSYLGYDTIIKPVFYDKVARFKLNANLEESSFLIGPVEIVNKDRVANSYSFDTEDLEGMVGPMESVERVAIMEAGVVSNNELSSSYSVRGGNFDENLVYLNDFEVYRPQLTRSGVQEGLSILNPDMVANIQFYAGGFAANYGDKMSSVLDVQYRKPTDFGMKISGGLLGAQLMVEGLALDKRFTYLIGARNRRNSYLLNSLDVKGEYKPVFNDIQTYMTYQLGLDWELSSLLYYSGNNYVNEPITAQVRLGNVQDTKNLYVGFDGKEVSSFQTYSGGTQLKYFNEESGYTFKWMNSVFISDENEAFDVLGVYRLQDVETNMGSDEFGNTVPGAIGYGSYHNFARNYLDIFVFNTEIKNYYIKRNHSFQWGLKYQREQIEDQLQEWTRIDSAGYSVPYSTSEVLLDHYLSDQNSMISYRGSGYVQDEWKTTLKDSSTLGFNLGIRGTYWDFNEELNISPRTQLLYRPSWEKKYAFRFASGVYYQPPFYRELRRLDGTINTGVLAQRSIHLALGSDYEFEMWNRPFKFSTEVYHKFLSNLNTYEVDNVKVRYYADNNAKGFAQGIDFRLNGEFVKGADSWFNLSFMNTQEDILDDSYIRYYNDTGAVVNPIVEGFGVVDSQETVYPGYIPRPTNQFMTFNIFFQDYVRSNENIKVHLNFIFGTGFKFGPPDNKRYKDTLSLPMYRRVDLGFSGLILKGAKQKYDETIFRHVNSIWGTLEIFNLLDVANTVSYLWIRDTSSRLFAVPNHLTSRLVNVKFVIKI